MKNSVTSYCYCCRFCITSSFTTLITITTIIMMTTTTQRTTALRLSIPTKKNSNNIVVIGGGIQGTSVAYHLAKATQQEFIAKTDSATAITSITILEAKAPASAASGKGGGFMARSWGNGTPTQRLHELAFDMYSEIANEIGCESFRKLPVLSVSPGYNGVEVARKDTTLSPLLPNWLDGNVGTISAMGYGQDTAQVTPLEFVQKMIQATSDRVSVVLGTCTGIETDPDSEQENGTRTITAVKYTTQDGGHEALLPADVVIVSAGPWSCAAEQWFQGAVALPMEGIKSTSIVWKKPEGDESVDATALFCGEHDQFGTHLEVYPRPDGTIYICGIGGSDYISKEELQAGAFRDVCDPKQNRVKAASSAFQEMSSLYTKNGELERVQACMRPCPPDALPYMGRIPGFDGAFINAGHNCWGIAWAPACGKAMAELVLNGDCTSVDLGPFNPARFTKPASRSGRGRKRGDVDVGEQW